MADWQITLISVLAFWLLLSLAAIRSWRTVEQRRPLPRHPDQARADAAWDAMPVRDHVEETCGDPACCVDEWDSALWVLVEEES